MSEFKHQLFAVLLGKKKRVRLFVAGASLLAAGTAFAQLDDSCTISVLNQAVQVNADGTWALPNVPADIGRIRVRATCVENGATRTGFSDFFEPAEGADIDISDIRFDVVRQVPQSISIDAPLTQLDLNNTTVQLSVVGNFADGTLLDLTETESGTSYVSSNAAIIAVDDQLDGSVIAVTSGTAIISALNEGVLATIQISALLTDDRDADGLPDDFELANACLDAESDDSGSDPDADLLDSLREFELGTNPCLDDTDGDGLADGREVDDIGSDPLLVDTDGDGFDDAAEVAAGTDPLSDTFDRFDGDRIDDRRWDAREVARRLRDGQLQSSLSFNSIAEPHGESNLLAIQNPAAFDGLATVVTVTGVELAVAAEPAGGFRIGPFAGVVGSFYGDGSASGSLGDVVAGAGLLTDATAINGGAFAAQCLDEDCAALSLLLFDVSSFGSFAEDQAVPATVAWDGTQFTFDVNGTIRTFDPTLSVAIGGPPGDAFRSVGTLVAFDPPSFEASGLIESHFDNAFVDVGVGDEFDGARIDPQNWQNLELVREVSDGAFLSSLASMDRPDINLLPVAAAFTANSISSDIAVTAVDNSDALPAALVLGSFFNVAAVRDGALGDVRAGIGIADIGGVLADGLLIERCDDADCEETATLALAFGNFGVTPIIGQAHRVGVSFANNTLLFEFDGGQLPVSLADLGIVTAVGEPSQRVMGLATLVEGIETPGEGALVSAEFDNVVVRRIDGTVPP